MNDRIQIKQNGEYITLPELMRRQGRVLLEYKPLANQIQVKLVCECCDERLIVLGSLGALKHDFGDDT